jgi:hypothetical protein
MDISANCLPYNRGQHVEKTGHFECISYKNKATNAPLYLHIRGFQQRKEQLFLLSYRFW